MLDIQLLAPFFILSLSRFLLSLTSRQISKNELTFSQFATFFIIPFQFDDSDGMGSGTGFVHFCAGGDSMCHCHFDHAADVSRAVQFYF